MEYINLYLVEHINKSLIMQSMNCGGVVNARAELLFIITMYKEFLSYLGEEARES